MKKSKLLALAAAAFFGLNANAQVELPDEGGTYYVYNKDVGSFLTRGSNWGTRGYVSSVAIPFTISKVSDGVYKFEPTDFKKNNLNRGLSDNGYVDTSNPHSFTVTGNADAYQISIGGKYISAPGNMKNIVLGEVQGNWQFFTQEQYDNKLKALAVSQNQNAAKDAGIEVPAGKTLDEVLSTDWALSLKVNADPKSGSYARIANWNRLNVVSVEDGTSDGRGQNFGNVAVGIESFQGGGRLTRTISGLKPGLYKVDVKGSMRATSNALCVELANEGIYPSDAYAVANGNIVPIKAWASDRSSDGEPNGPQAVADLTESGKYTTSSLVCVGEDGNLNVEINANAWWNAMGRWFMFVGVDYTQYISTAAPVDYSSLNEEIDKAKDLLKTYDSGSAWYTELNSAIQTANAALSATKQTDVDAALKSLKDAETKAADDCFKASWATSADLADGTYYIKNKEAGKYLSNGANWGTRSALFGNGIAYDFTIGEDGKYTLKSGIKNVNNALRPTDGFNDQSGAWVILKTGTPGEFYMYCVENQTYFYYDGTNVPQLKSTPDESCVWVFATPEQRKVCTPGADVTTYIKCPDFILNDVKNTDAAWEGPKKFNGIATSANTIANNRCAEVYNGGTFEFKQTIDDIPNGVYKVTCQGFFRGENPSQLFANEASVALRDVASENLDPAPNSMDQASTAFDQGLYVNVLEDVFVKDGTLTLGIKRDGEATNEWTIFDTFTLTYVRELTEAEKAVAPTSVTVTGDATEIFEGETTTFVSSVNAGATETVKWTTSNADVATVDNNGEVTAVGVGEATITATSSVDDKVSGSKKITVKAVPSIVVTDFSNGDVISVKLNTYAKDGDPAQMQDIYGFNLGVENGDARTGGIFEYGNTEGNLAGNGTAPAAGPDGKSGKALGILAVWTGTVQYVLDVTLPAGNYIMSIPTYCVGGATAVTKNLTGVKIGSTENFSSAKTFTIGSWTTQDVKFDLDEETDVTISLGYTAANTGAGNCPRLFYDAVNIKSKNADMTKVSSAIAEAIAAVEEGKHPVIAATGVSLDQTSAELEIGETVNLKATVTPDNATDKTVVWTSSKEAVATVANGVVTAVAEGTATITATCGDVKATATITVKAPVIAATEVNLNQTAATLEIGESVTLKATVAPDNATDKTVTWTTNNDKVATVVNGVVTAKGEGTATITATCGSVKATATITVNAPAPVGPASIEIAHGTKAAASTEEMDITYKRNFAVANKWQSLYVPFSIDMTEVKDVVIAKFDNVEVDGDEVTISISKVTTGSIPAQTPLFIAAVTAGDKSIKTGVSTIEAAIDMTTIIGDAAVTGILSEPKAGINGNYIMSGGNLCYVPESMSSIKLGVNHWYMSLSVPGAKIRINAIGFDTEEATGIASAIAESLGAKAYSINGTQVDASNAKGVYIQNGKKFIRK